MRTIFFVALVLFFLVAGSFLLINKDSRFPYEIPYLRGVSSMGLSSVNVISGSEEAVLPREEWERILTNGEWDFTTVFYSMENIYRFDGEVEFKPDGTFSRYVTLSYYRGTPKKVLEEDEYLKSVSGGSVTGKWGLAQNGESFWYEQVEKCNGKVSFQASNSIDPVNICGAFAEGEVYTYGTKKDELSKYEMKSFKADHIAIEGKNFADEGRYVFIFYKGKD